MTVLKRFLQGEDQRATEAPARGPARGSGKVSVRKFARQSTSPLSIMDHVAQFPQQGAGCLRDLRSPRVRGKPTPSLWSSPQHQAQRTLRYKFSGQEERVLWGFRGFFVCIYFCFVYAKQLKLKLTSPRAPGVSWRE